MNASQRALLLLLLLGSRCMKAAVSNRFPEWAVERGSCSLAGGTTADA